jgi:hypothetical protein
VRELQIGGGGLFNKTEIIAVNATTLASPLATTFTANTGANVPFTLLGRRTPNAAKYSGNGYVRYEFSQGALKNTGLGLSYIYMAPRREGDAQRWSESWSRFDFNASYRTKLFNKSVSIVLRVQNVQDIMYWQGNQARGAPRTTSLQVTTKF